jgi:hypothetical protein
MEAANGGVTVIFLAYVGCFVCLLVWCKPGWVKNS